MFSSFSSSFSSSLTKKTLPPPLPTDEAEVTKTSVVRHATNRHHPLLAPRLKHNISCQPMSGQWPSCSCSRLQSATCYQIKSNQVYFRQHMAHKTTKKTTKNYKKRQTDRHKNIQHNTLKRDYQNFVKYMLDKLIIIMSVNTNKSDLCVMYHIVKSW